MNQGFNIYQNMNQGYIFTRTWIKGIYLPDDEPGVYIYQDMDQGYIFTRTWIKGIYLPDDEPGV